MQEGISPLLCVVLSLSIERERELRREGTVPSQQIQFPPVTKPPIGATHELARAHTAAEDRKCLDFATQAQAHPYVPAVRYPDDGY